MDRGSRPRSLGQVLGTNGAGKTTLLREIAGSGRSEVHTVDRVILTHAQKWQLVLIGDYLTRRVHCVGADAIRGGKQALLHALDVAAQFAVQTQCQGVMWEGIIIMTRQYHHEFVGRGLRPAYFVVDTPLDECFRRIEARSGRTRAQLKGNGKIVVGRVAGVERLATWFAAQGAPVLRVSGEDALWTALREMWR